MRLRNASTPIPHVKRYVNESGRSTTLNSGLAIFCRLAGLDICSNRGNARKPWLVSQHSALRVGCVYGDNSECALPSPEYNVPSLNSLNCPNLKQIPYPRLKTKYNPTKKLILHPIKIQYAHGLDICTNRGKAIRHWLGSRTEYTPCGIWFWSQFYPHLNIVP